MSEANVQAKNQSAPPGADYFSVFGLARKLALDAKALERTFYQKSREVHPDRFARASAEQQQWSLEQTSLLNDAYRALKDPIARTEYLLRLEGVNVPEDREGVDREKKQPPPELLAEVFELNMQLEEMRMNAKMGEDDPQLRTDLEAARTQFAGQLREIEQEIAAEGVGWDAGLGVSDPIAQREALSKLAALLDKRRYVRNLLRDVSEALSNSPNLSSLD